MKGKQGLRAFIIMAYSILECGFYVLELAWVNNRTNQLSEYIMEVQDYTIHPGYDHEYLRNDLILIRFVKNFFLQASMQLACQVLLIPHVSQGTFWLFRIWTYSGGHKCVNRCFRIWRFKVECKKYAKEFK